MEEDFEVSDFSSLLVDDEHEQTENNGNYLVEKIDVLFRMIEFQFVNRTTVILGSLI